MYFYLYYLFIDLFKTKKDKKEKTPTITKQTILLFHVYYVWNRKHFIKYFALKDILNNL